MTGIFGALDIARQGLIVTQAGVRTTGHNIANADTPGYTQQRIHQSSEIPQRLGGLIQGTGVRFLTVERITDPFVEAQLIRQQGAAAAAKAQSGVLSAVEQVLNEQDAEGLTRSLNKVYDALEDLATSGTPGAPAERAALVATAQGTVDLIHNTDARLRDLMASVNDGIEGLIPGANLLLEQINQLNQEITGTEVREFENANDLRDQRDEKMRELAGLMDIRSFERANGAVTVSLSNGVALVEGNRARTLVAVPDPTNPFSTGFVRIEVHDLSATVDVTNDVGAGELGGRLRARDTILPAAIRSLDTVAYNLTTSINTVHNLGAGLTGATGDFFTALPQVEDAARDLSLAANILANPDDIAAGLTNAAGDNRNALALAALRDQKSPLFLPGDPPGPASGPSRSVLEHAVAVTVDIGQQARSMESSVLQQQNVIDGLRNQRDAISGVSIDEEVTRLVRLQATFQANARMINVVQTLLDDLVNIL